MTEEPVTKEDWTEKARPITVEVMDSYLRTDAEVTDLVRAVIRREIMVTSEERAMRSAFMFMLLGPTMEKAATERVGGLIGYMSDTVPGRGMNGYPIFTKWSYLHIDNVDFYDAEMSRLQALLNS